MGIRGASDLVAASQSTDGPQLLKSLAEKTSLNEATVAMIARHLSQQAIVQLIGALRFRTKAAAPTAPSPKEIAAQVAQNLDVVGLKDLNPVARLSLRA